MLFDITRLGTDTGRCNVFFYVKMEVAGFDACVCVSAVALLDLVKRGSHVACLGARLCL